MTSIFIVRARDHDDDQSTIYGVYPTAEQAMARVKFLETDKDYGHDSAWYDEVKGGISGADCEL